MARPVLLCTGPWADVGLEELAQQAISSAAQYPW